MCWKMMKNRCSNPNDPKFKNHGGRGITVCKEWVESFDRFIQDIGERPEGYTIDRIDNNLGYCKENCKWSSYTEQNNNKNNNIRLTYNGECKTVSEWAKHLNMNVQTLFWRINNNKTVSEILFNHTQKQ